MIFKVGGPDFLKSRMARQCQPSGECLRGCAPLRSWSFFENVGANEAIWCTIFHHVKHLTACFIEVLFALEAFRTGWSKKVEGLCPSV